MCLIPGSSRILLSSLRGKIPNNKTKRSQRMGKKRKILNSFQLFFLFFPSGNFFLKSLKEEIRKNSLQQREHSDFEAKQIRVWM
jgi:hypothetical protein